MNKKIKKIAVCASQVPFMSGGAENLVNDLVSELEKRKYDVELINIPHKWYPNEQLLKDIMIWRLIDLSESNGKKIDLVITTKFPSYYVNHPNKRIWLVHQLREAYDLYKTEYSIFNESDENDLKIRNKIIELDNRFLKEYRNIFTISKNVSKRLKKYNDIDSTVLYPPPKNEKRFFNEDYGDYILYVGRLDPLKRIDHLVEALKFTDNNIKCKIAGTGNDMERLYSLVKKHKLEHRIEFLGYVSDDELIDLYSRCFAVFFAPLDEDYGFITIEAFLSRKPVITASDSGGSLEFVKDNKNGFVVRPDDYKKFAKKIDLLFSDKSLCKKFGDEGYRNVKKITWDKVINKLIEN